MVTDLNPDKSRPHGYAIVSAFWDREILNRLLPLLGVIICRDPLVQSIVMFGRGRPQNGIIIQPTKGHEIDPNDTVALAQFKDDIWCVCISHSLFLELIFVCITKAQR